MQVEKSVYLHQFAPGLENWVCLEDKNKHTILLAVIFLIAHKLLRAISATADLTRASERARPLIRPRYLDEALDKGKVL
jgi:hypothetical protein